MWRKKAKKLGVSTTKKTRQGASKRNTKWGIKGGKLYKKKYRGQGR